MFVNLNVCPYVEHFCYSFEYSASTFLEMLLSVLFPFKFDAIHASDWPPILQSYKPYHSPDIVQAHSHILPKVKLIAQSLCSRLLAEMLSLGNVHRLTLISSVRFCQPTETLRPAMSMLCTRAMSQCAPQQGQG